MIELEPPVASSTPLLNTSSCIYPLGSLAMVTSAIERIILKKCATRRPTQVVPSKPMKPVDKVRELPLDVLESILEMSCPSISLDDICWNPFVYRARLRERGESSSHLDVFPKSL